MLLPQNWVVLIQVPEDSCFAVLDSAFTTPKKVYVRVRKLISRPTGVGHNLRCENCWYFARKLLENHLVLGHGSRRRCSRFSDAQPPEAVIFHPFFVEDVVAAIRHEIISWNRHQNIYGRDPVLGRARSRRHLPTDPKSPSTSSAGTTSPVSYALFPVATTMTNGEGWGRSGGGGSTRNACGSCP